ncbi:MAG: hypothetical protein CMJ42_23085 [Phyllobacteriaceae bacterium]|nr:hypothetical protein [Phyllobacteriaceae bacterium]MBA89234.1 hypothetical protein [Phyllobacteriaceae bacterium]
MQPVPPRLSAGRIVSNVVVLALLVIGGAWAVDYAAVWYGTSPFALCWVLIRLYPAVIALPYIFGFIGMVLLIFPSRRGQGGFLLVLALILYGAPDMIWDFLGDRCA